MRVATDAARGRGVPAYGREVAAAPANRFGLGDVERGHVLVYGVAVFELGVPVAEDVVDGVRPQQIGPVPGLVERDGQRIPHIGHHREVQQLGDVDLVVQPTRIGAVVLLDHLRHFASLNGAVVPAARSGLGERDLGLLLDPVPLEPPLRPALIGCGDRPQATADHAAERKDQPPEVPREMKQSLHKASMPSPGWQGGDRLGDEVGDRPRSGEHPQVIPVFPDHPPASPFCFVGRVIVGRAEA
jgi:hypothetical protein